MARPTKDVQPHRSEVQKVWVELPRIREIRCVVRHGFTRKVLVSLGNLE